MKQLMLLVLFLCSTISFAQKQKENIFEKISVNNPTTPKSKAVNPITDVFTIAIINDSKGLAREVLVQLKRGDDTLYPIIDMNAKTEQDILNANIYFVLANLGYTVPEIKDKCWSIIKIQGIDYIALFIDISKLNK